MAETRLDALVDEFDSLRLEVLDVADACKGNPEFLYIEEILRAILAKYPQRNVPPSKKGK